MFYKELNIFLAPFDILKDAVAPTAFHDSGERVDPPKCHPNTRVAVLEKIMNWIQRSDAETKDRYIMWLTGAAGAGKTAIAQSFIELCLQRGLVVASFFFGRSDGSRNHARALIATLVYQIYRLVPEVQNKILSVIDEDPLILTKTMEHQFMYLIMKPLHSVCSSGTPWAYGSHCCLIIDGLDECHDREVQQHILRMISSSIHKIKLPILFLVASRPEHEIKLEFASPQMDGIHARLYLDDTYKPLDDIRTYLQDSFETIRTGHPYKSRIPVVWPTNDTVERLVKKSSGQFIYAATVIRYVQSIRHLPHHRLETTMNLRPAQGDLPFAQLDALYAMILSSAADIDRVLYAISIYLHNVVQTNPRIYDSFDIEQFMSLDAGELDILFCDLGALVSIESTTLLLYDTNVKLTKNLRILHASLYDFLSDPMRSKEYFIDTDTYRPKHVVNVLRFVTSPLGVIFFCL